MKKLTYPAAFTRDRTVEQWVEHHRRVVAILITAGLLCSYPMGVFLMAVATAPLRPAPAAPVPKPIRGAGVVVSMNENTGTMVVQHSGVQALDIAPGATSFRADAAVLGRTQVGDRINFDLTREGGAYTITGTQASPEE